LHPTASDLLFTPQMPHSLGRWQFWIDRGGTFTDIVGCAPDDRILSAKLLSDNPEHYSDAAVEGIRQMLDLKPGEPIPADRIASIKMGTTAATNALLERKGEPTVLVITRGLADVLRIGTQQRPKLFDLRIVLPEPLYESVVEVGGRFSAEGEELEPLDLIAVRDSLKQVRARGVRAAAVVCLHGYRYPQHENAIAEVATQLGFSQVSTSHETSHLINLVNRGDTTVVDAYLSPVLRRYVDSLRQALPGIPLFFMQSNGGLVDAARFQGKNSILSGPAGGIVGAAKAATRAGTNRIIGFDMGGTSTDVTHYAGEFERRFETEVAGVRICVPMMHIHTVAAGGGSICSFDGGRLRVGPESAGANPGPAAYRRGGPLTVTDCNVLLGRLPPDFFPKIFGSSGDLPLDTRRVNERFRELAAQIASSSQKSLTPEELASGFLRIAVDNMANAIKKISVARGYDVTGYTLVTFGGAGGQHACAVADALRMERVLIHPFAGVLSAYGIGLAELRALRESSVELPLTLEGTTKAQRTLSDLEQEVREELQLQHSETEKVLRKFHLRYRGANTTLPVQAGSISEMIEAFQAGHRSRFGFAMNPEERGLVIAAVSVEAIGRDELPSSSASAGLRRQAQPAVTAVSRGAPKRNDGGPLIREESGSSLDADRPRMSGSSSLPLPVGQTNVMFSGNWESTPIFDRETLSIGSVITGPALIIEPTTVTVIEPGWRGEITEEEDLVLSRTTPRAVRLMIDTDPDPILLEVFNNVFMSIAEQMGAVLQNAAYSVNIKERLDFSCALFDAQGRLVANAPHIPVHLGSMGGAVRAIIERRGGTVRAGDVFALNDPFAGGTHLPDITVATPVFTSGRQPTFWVASRGHHADIGGITPGSMPPASTTIDEEGIRITDFLLVEQGRFRQSELVELLSSGRYPARNIPQNIGDLHAQIAANEKGARELAGLVEQFGLEGVQAYMGHVRSNAAEQARRVIDRLKPGHFIQRMDSGAEVHVRIDIDARARRAKIDFTGTSAQTTDNFNAPSAIVSAAVLYVFRTLIREEIPLNDGCLDALEIVVPEGSMLAPAPPAAVVAGNVETSQAIANALYGALGVLAASQGTMNNLTFGNDRYQYYETICGGAGAGSGFAGASAVHTHMTNTRLTDPEVLELRYPVVLEGFEIRRGSGGHGHWCGGDGVVRKLRFREPMNVAILANHRSVPPFGLEGGEPGQVGLTSILRTDGRVEVLQSCDQCSVGAGDTIIVETPGGGGYGEVISNQ
jgi:5-oxoprolinase (ATP-hydrolysing)